MRKANNPFATKREKVLFGFRGQVFKIPTLLSADYNSDCWGVLVVPFNLWHFWGLHFIRELVRRCPLKLIVVIEWDWIIARTLSPYQSQKPSVGGDDEVITLKEAVTKINTLNNSDANLFHQEHCYLGYPRNIIGDFGRPRIRSSYADLVGICNKLYALQ